MKSHHKRALTKSTGVTDRPASTWRMSGWRGESNGLGAEWPVGPATEGGHVAFPGNTGHGECLCGATARGSRLLQRQ